MPVFSVLNRFISINSVRVRRWVIINSRNSSNAADDARYDEDGFRILDLKKKKTTNVTRRKREQRPVLPPRASRMLPDQKWSDVWPGPRTFHPATVPLPVRQGVNKLGAPPSKWANVELMKIPNFLHLTPPAIEGHCNALKKFCTEWPKELNDEKIGEMFPLEIISSDYCHSSPSIRDPLARIVTIKFPLSKLEFDKHSKDKFLRLIGDKYDEETDIVTITCDKCPLKQQNYEYAIYLLTAVYHESWVIEPWESEKMDIDLEYYDWDNSKSKENVKYLLSSTSREDQLESETVTEYKDAAVALFDEGENEYNINNYKEKAKKLLFS